ncbi:MAG: XdhC family protein [Pseudomonadota bacterium]
MKAHDLSALNAARASRHAIAAVTPLDGSDGRLVRRDEADADPLADALRARFLSGKSGIEVTAEGEVFIGIHRPPPRLVVIGAVHVSQALAPMAKATGFDVTIIDPRTAFATPERFEGVDLVAEWPDEALMALDHDTAIATLTHDPKIDDPAIIAALKSPCFYLGALGSRKTHAKRLTRLRDAGFGDDDFQRIHAPIGVNIGAATPQEIAVAVLAEVVGAMRQPKPATAPKTEPAPEVAVA